VDKEKPIERFLPLRPVELDVLVSLAGCERHRYGRIQDSGTRGISSPPDVGTLYRALARMLEQKLIQESTRREAPDVGNERRNYYRITPLGLRVAQAEARRMAALTRAARASGLLKETAR